nr:DUF3025 domain-containing protein [Niveibacterium umoris]
MRRFAAGLPSIDDLDAALADPGPRPTLRDGTPVRLVANAHAAGYEAGIAASGAVPTREHDWHDFFNALVWCRFPQAKAALNAAHLEELTLRGAGAPRGPRRDRLTQFDECGVVVSASDPALLAALRAHDWRGLFWEHRAAWGRSIDVVVFGHATLDQLRAPFVGLCGKALLREVPSHWFADDAAARNLEVDAWLAERLAGLGAQGSPARLQALPLLGIPGLSADSETAAYYDDTRQFRPLAQPRAAAASDE